MYSIGQFSVMFQVNRKTLRYYDEIGLFKPAYVDETNQYRYYEESQIPIMKEIRRLREVGIPLEEISSIVTQQEHKKTEEYLNRRLIEIDNEQRELERQKRMIKQYQQENGVERDGMVAYKVEEGKFLPAGHVYYLEVHCEWMEIHDKLSTFYENAREVSLQGTHYFKMNMGDELEEVSEIFAYTEDEGHSRVKTIEGGYCLKVECEGMEQKIDAYQAVFDHAKKQKQHLGSLYERYDMEQGKMHITILAEVL